MDYKFDVSRPREAYRHRACRDAVFFPTLGAGWTENTANAYDRLRETWRARVVALRDAGWKRFAKNSDFQVARNCPPFGAWPVSGRPPKFNCRIPKL